MKRPGAPDPQYVQARKLLLDVIDALGAQRDAVILIGAQAVYLRTAAEEIAVAEFTRDADLAINPAELKDAPALSEIMQSLGLECEEPGIWTMPDSTERADLKNEVDLIVPEAVASKKGKRAARLQAPHGKETARKTRGVEGALLDHEWMPITALDPADRRILDIRVAGATALLISKLHKLGERQDKPTRLKNKDAFDVYRLLRATRTEVFVGKVEELRRHDWTRAVTEEAITYLRELFATATSMGSRMAGEAAVPFEDPEVIANTCAALAQDILSRV